jgi:hypothetical protein
VLIYDTVALPYYLARLNNHAFESDCTAIVEYAAAGAVCVLSDRIRARAGRTAVRGLSVSNAQILKYESHIRRRDVKDAVAHVA